MLSKQVITGIALAVVLASAPARADDQHRRRDRESQPSQQQAQRPPESRTDDRAVDRAVPRATPQPDVRNEQRYSAPPYQVAPRYETVRPYNAYRAPYYSNRAYRGTPRIIRPNIVTVVPYRP